MYRLIKQLNKFNGNICFAGETNYGGIVFECDRDSKTIDYDTSTKNISDICLEDGTSYLVAFSDSYIGQYSGGSLDETYVDTGINSVDKIVNDYQGNVYILSKTNNQLIKYNSSIIWTISLPDYDLRQYSQILFRESDGFIIYYNNTNIHVIRDDVSRAVILNSLSVSGNGYIKSVIGSEFIPSYTYARVRQVMGGELGQSSSSS